MFLHPLLLLGLGPGLPIHPHLVTPLVLQATSKSGVKNAKMVAAIIPVLTYDGSYYCTCNPGYHLSNNYHTCMDINECALDNGGCDQKCINEPGSFSCACYEGFRLDHYRCQDIDKCSEDNCD